MEKHLSLPLTKEIVKELKIGDTLYLTGVIYTARDAAHQRMEEALNAKKPLPVDLTGQILYYMGPSPARPGRAIGSAGPTTATRMDKYTPRLLDLGLAGMIGKGKRTDAVKEAAKRNGAIYMVAVGGAGALLSKAILSSTVEAYEDLGTEAIRRLEVKDFPVIVALDTAGNDLYKEAVEEFRVVKE